MLMNIKCNPVTSVAVHLIFDDKSEKDVNISKGDLIVVDFNQNGLRRHFEGRVISINTTATDPKAWSIIVDGSDDFQSDQVRFSPMNILDIEIIRKAEAVRYIETPNNYTGIAGLRVVKGRLQYTCDGFNWFVVSGGRHHHNSDSSDDFIYDEEGTCHPHPFEDTIRDEVM